jgi:hypothetical protein
MTGASSGNIRGSLIVNATGDQITFVKTGTALVADTYTVTFRSAATGFHEGANLLDGNGDGTTGDNYTNTFVRTSIPVVTATIPDFARGHGQAVNVWNPAVNGSFDGIPVLLNSGVGVRSVSFTVNYNPALLTIDSVTLGTGVAAGSVLTANAATPGTVTVTVSNASADLAATAGQLTLVNLKTTGGAPGVPSSAPYGAKHVLDIDNLIVQDPASATIASAANDGVHVAAYPGELNGNQAYNGPDASFTQQLVLNPTTGGLIAYQLADPVIIADINGNGLIQGNDAAQVQRMILNLGSPFIPNKPTEANTTAGLDPKLFVTTSAHSAAPGESFTASVNMLVTEASGITFGGADIGLAYDASMFTVTGVSPGDLTSGNGFASSADFSMPGVIRFSAITSTNGLAKAIGSQGVILTATFKVNAGASAGTSLLNITDSAPGITTALFDGSVLRNNLSIRPAITDGADGGDATMVVIGDSSFDALFLANYLSAGSDADAFRAAWNSTEEGEEDDFWLSF